MPTEPHVPSTEGPSFLQRHRAITSCTRLVNGLARRARHSNPGVDVDEAAGNALERLVIAMEKPSFPWRVAERHATKLWKGALSEQQALRGLTHAPPSHDVIERVRRNLAAVRDAGDVVTVDNVYDHGIHHGNAKTAPSRDAVRYVLDGVVELDAGWYSDDNVVERAVPADATGRYLPAGEDTEHSVGFSPTNATRDDLDLLNAARTNDPGDDGGIDCTRLDILALLYFELRKNSNRTMTAAYSDREKRRLLGVDADGLARLKASLDLAVQRAKDDAANTAARVRERLAEYDAAWKRASGRS